MEDNVLELTERIDPIPPTSFRFLMGFIIARSPICKETFVQDREEKRRNLGTGAWTMHRPTIRSLLENLSRQHAPHPALGPDMTRSDCYLGGNLKEKVQAFAATDRDGLGAQERRMTLEKKNPDSPNVGKVRIDFPNCQTTLRFEHSIN
jgi:hypothetical protein